MSESNPSSSPELANKFTSDAKFSSDINVPTTSTSFSSSKSGGTVSSESYYQWWGSFQSATIVQSDTGPENECR